MRFLKAIYISSILLITAILVGSCDSYLRTNEERKPIARVGENYLYREDVALFINEEMSVADSTSFVNNYLNNWAVRELLMSKAKINLSEEKVAEFEQLVANYRNDLYTRAYREALVLQAQDTLVTNSQLTSFYDVEKENFKLKEKLVRLRFIELPLQFLDKELVTEKLKRFNDEDAVYLDSIGVHFKKLHFNDSIWVNVSRIMEQIRPLTFENEERYLKNSQFFELQDSLGVYLAQVTNVLDVNDVAPLRFIEPTIRQVLMNRRKQEYIRKLETEIIDEAIKEKEFEIYEKNE